VGALSAATGLGSHTTTSTTLYHFPSGGDLLDSPGVREFSIWRYDEEEIRHGFREFTARFENCKFNNCRHLSEPQCAIKDALEKGEITQQRMDHYQRMLVEMNDSSILPP